MHVTGYDANGTLQEMVDDVRCIFGVDMYIVHLMNPDGMYFLARSGPLPEELTQCALERRVREYGSVPNFEVGVCRKDGGWIQAIPIKVEALRETVLGASVSGVSPTVGEQEGEPRAASG